MRGRTFFEGSIRVAYWAPHHVRSPGDKPPPTAPLHTRSLLQPSSMISGSHVKPFSSPHGVHLLCLLRSPRSLCGWAVLLFRRAKREHRVAVADSYAMEAASNTHTCIYRWVPSGCYLHSSQPTYESRSSMQSRVGSTTK